MRRNRRVELAALLCATYNAFQSYTLYSVCANSEFSYTEAEQMSEEYSSMFGVEIPTSAFLPNADKYSDLSIHFYKEYSRCCKELDGKGYDKGTVDAFCNMVLNGAEGYRLQMFRSLNAFGFSQSMMTFYAYVKGAANIEELKNGMVIFGHGGMQRMTPSMIKLFIRTMYRVVYAFEDIATKRKERNEKTNSRNLERA